MSIAQAFGEMAPGADLANDAIDNAALDDFVSLAGPYCRQAALPPR
jgi:hypothetical protein